MRREQPLVEPPRAPAEKRSEERRRIVKSILESDNTNVVGVIACRKDLQIALSDEHPDVRIFEVRVDKHQPPMKLLRRLSAHKPLIITVRSKDEGGNISSIVRRAKLFEKYMEFAAFIDIEAASYMRLLGVIEEARVKGIGVILSAHFPKGMFDAKAIGDTVAYAVNQHCFHRVDIVKVAVNIEEVSELAALLQVHAETREFYPYVGTAFMAIGEHYGVASRLTFSSGRFRTTLVYGCMGKPIVPGQPSAFDLAYMISRLGISSARRR